MTLRIQRLAGVLLLAWFLLLFTGVAEWVHDQVHDAEDAAVIAAAKAAGLPEPQIPKHDETNCPIHALLHMPLLRLAGWVPLLVCLGVFLAFLSLFQALPALCSLPARIDCRGPPVSH